LWAMADRGLKLRTDRFRAFLNSNFVATDKKLVR
jgi:hypothetical protein